MLEKIQVSWRFYKKACRCVISKHAAGKSSRKYLTSGQMEQYTYCRNDMMKQQRRHDVCKKVAKLALTTK